MRERHMVRMDPDLYLEGFGFRWFVFQTEPDGPFTWQWEAWRGQSRWGWGDADSKESARAAAVEWWRVQAGYPAGWGKPGFGQTVTG
jgi:hypothetical protein